MSAQSADDLTNKQLLDALTDVLGTMSDNMATKDDIREALSNHPTKDDLKAFATKDDLKAFATKDDLKAFATKDDMRQMEMRLTRKIDGNQSANIKHHLETRKMIGTLNRQFGHMREGLAKAAEAV